MYSLSSCIEIKMSIPQAAHTTVTMYARRVMSIFALLKALILAVFRGCLRAFGKCTDGGASSKGGQNLDSVRLTV